MIRLDTVNRSLTLFLDGAQVSAPLQIVVSYSDQTAATYLGASQLSNSNGVTAVTICAAPAASTIRDIDMVTVLNTDTGSQVVTIQLLDTATTYKIISTTLLVGEKLTYTHGSAWQVLDNTGNLKTVVLSTSGVNSFSAGSTGLTPSTATTGAVTLGGTLAVASGGTGTSSPSLVAGTNVSITGTWPNQTVNSTASGSVTSVTATSPVASSGGATPDISLSASYGDTQNPYASKTANYVLAAPDGAAGVPTFRALTTADIPALAYVTSVGATAPITSTGGATPTIGVTAAALDKVDDTNVTMTLSGSPSTALIAATTMGLGWTGQLAVSRGGTGAATTTANFVFAGPSSGSPAAPTFRALTTADIPALAYGSVSSVGLALPSIMTVSGSPVTSSGTLTGTLTTQAVNAIFAGPSSGAAAAPTFRSLTTADIPALSYVTSVAASVPAFLSIAGSPITTSGTLAISYSGTALPIANGGTGQTTASAAFNALSPVTTTGDLIIGNGTNSATRLAIGANTYVLTSNGTTATWAAGGGGGSSAYTRTTFTATAGQTAFTVTYAVGYLQIYVNGVLLTGSDYTASSGTGFTLNVACAVGDIVEALVITTSVTGVTTGKAIAMAMIFGY